VISLVFVLFSLAPLLVFGQALPHPTAQTGPTAEWDEGLPVVSDMAQAELALPSVATAPGTYYRTFSGSRFQPTASALTYAALGGAIYATALPPGGFSFSMDFDLPHGATITEVVFFVIDNDATNMGLSLRSYDPETDAFVVIESSSSSGASSALQAIVIPVDPQIQVNNTTTSYRLRVAPSVATSTHLLRGARVGYTVPLAYLPMITR